MRDALLPSLTDDGFSQRMEAIEALTKLRDTTLLPIFERIAESDSYVEAGTGIRRVRVAAAQAVTVLTKSH
jgi:HEAT repeat protein